MSLIDLVAAFLRTGAIQLYGLLALASGIAAALMTENPLRTLLAALVMLPIYPFAEYLIHRFILHNRALYRSPATAASWKRIHFDHHQDPLKLDVLFGALWTTLPMLLVLTVPTGFAVGGPPGAFAAFATGLLLFTNYEFCHCLQHLNYTPKSRVLRRMKQLHLAHHFHNERGNFGIVVFWIDRLFGTFYPSPAAMPRSATTFNLGYDRAEAERYPWIAALTGAPPKDRPSDETASMNGIL
jgi:sterol desaturase/sphingolipid hydroxylase (fatty acid hydroxylase superfamily)